MRSYRCRVLLTAVSAVVTLATIPRFAAAQTGGPSAAAATVPAPVKTAPDTSAVTSNMVDEGRAIFHGAGTCFMCHGAQLEGGPIAPTLKAHKWRDATNGELAQIFKVVTTGVAGTAMVSHPGHISDEQAEKVAAYVWSVSSGRAKP